MNTKLPECPIAAAIALVGDKWKIQIMREMLMDPETPKHFTDLKKKILNISDKMLSKSLKDLEADHIIIREVIDYPPPRNIYFLSNMGKLLTDVALSLDSWGKKYYKLYADEIAERKQR